MTEKDEKTLEEQMEASESELEIEVVDDVPEEEKPRQAKPPKEPEKAEEEEDDGLEDVSERVKKRISQLTYRAKEEERQRQEAARLREEAVNYAKKIHEENQRLRAQVEAGQGSLVEQAKARVTAELNSAKKEYREAYDNGDADGLLAAQERLARAQNEMYRLESYRPPQRPQAEEQPQQAQPQQPQQEPQQELDPRQKAWLQENPWFWNDVEMTGYVYGLHEKLVRNGVDPKSETYYTQINQALRKRFPENFEGGDDDTETVDVSPPPKKQPATVVASAQRGAQNPRNKVRLTQTQVALAKRLGLTKEQYAAQLLKEANNV